MLTFARLQNEVGEWSRRNFPDNTPRDPFEGLCEEFGELAHARLKGRQGIRGDLARHEAGEKDALADMIIFACDYAERRGFNLQDEIIDQCEDCGGLIPEGNSIATIQEYVRFADRSEDGDSAFYSMIHSLRQITKGGNSRAIGTANLVMDVCDYANLRGFDLETIVAETWAQVRQRDWLASPSTGQSASPPQAPQVKVMDFANRRVKTLPPKPDREPCRIPVSDLGMAYRVGRDDKGIFVEIVPDDGSPGLMKNLDDLQIFKGVR